MQSNYIFMLATCCYISSWLIVLYLCIPEEHLGLDNDSDEVT